MTRRLFRVMLCVPSADIPRFEILNSHARLSVRGRYDPASIRGCLLLDLILLNFICHLLAAVSQEKH